MLGQLTGACAAEGINIEDMTNKSKGDWAYTMMEDVYKRQPYNG